ncbi:MAG: WbuC family cupin fold metalloprotein [Verrucomicrobia bacterium]|jgi:cupin fold WbuC family metalloprotein|nr:WbuC family cupin fold metalloprotein [Verrucomicrobiota bacterium]
MLKKIDTALIVDCFKKAKQSPRKRSHFNLHEKLEAPVQRLCIAFVEGTYVRPHRHPASNKWELLIAVQDSSLLVIFDENGGISEHFELSPNGPMSAIEIPPNTWHTIFPADKESVVMEIKEGPYTPSKPEHFAPWSPEEGSPDADAYLRQIQSSIQ